MLDCLSNDVLQHINENLDVKSLAKLARVGKRFRNLINEERRPWEKLFLKRFGDTRYSIVRSTVKSWKAAFKKEHLEDSDFGAPCGDFGKVADCPGDWRPLLMPKLRLRIMDGKDQWYTVSRGGKENSGIGAAA